MLHFIGSGLRGGKMRDLHHPSPYSPLPFARPHQPRRFVFTESEWTISKGTTASDVTRTCCQYWQCCQSILCTLFLASPTSGTERPAVVLFASSASLSPSSSRISPSFAPHHGHQRRLRHLWGFHKLRGFTQIFLFIQTQMISEIFLNFFFYFNFTRNISNLSCRFLIYLLHLCY